MTTANFHFASVVAFLAVLLLVTFQYGQAIVCYQCNSEFDPRCGDPFDPYSLGTVNCSFRPRLEHLSNLEPTICRKTIQKVYGKIRIIRGCGYVTDENDDGECMRRSGTHDVQALFCSCTGDLCNSSVSKLPSWRIIGAAAFLLTWKTI